MHAPSSPLPLIHLDEALIVLDKPAGLLSVPGRGPDKADCAAARVQAVFPEARVVHRLDMGTSGLLIFARSLAAQQALSRAFETRQTRKRYEALVAGWPRQAAGTVDLPLACDWLNRPRQIIDPAGGKPSVTHWRRLAPVAGGARLSLAPVTGRSHQLRVHLMALGHPIQGDELYAPPAVQAAAPRLMLHAAELSLPHPLTGQPLHLQAPVPF